MVDSTATEKAGVRLEETGLISESDHSSEIFKYQLDLLKIEIDLVDRSIARDEARAQNVKNFAIVVWAAGITVFLGQPELRKYVVVTALLPVIFWYLDAWWTRLRMGAHLRARKIREYVNSQPFVESFQAQKLIDFMLLDVSGNEYKDTTELKRWSRLSRVMMFKEMLFLYGGLATFTVILGLIAFWIF